MEMEAKERTRNWFAETFTKYVLHYAAERFPPPIWQQLIENDDLLRQGYRLITAQWGDRTGRWEAGDRIYWHPETKHTIPVGQPQAAEPRPAASASGTGPRAGPTPVPQQPAKKDKGQWVAASVKANDPDNKLRLGQKAALKDNGDGTWTFATYHRGKIQHYGKLPTGELAARFQRELDKGKMITGQQVGAMGKQLAGDSGGSKFGLSDEQRDIDTQFAQNQKSDELQHMVINARAGTGKTTMLKHLAETYGKKGDKWLYLVFGTRNQQEAEEKFPKAFVTVRTTNAYGGDVLKANNLHPTDRMVQYTQKGQKIGEIMDGNHFRQKADTLGIVHYDDPRVDRSIKRRFKSIWIEFTREVKKLVGLAKSFNINPAVSQNLKQDILAVAQQYDINSDLERVKESIEKNANKDWLNGQISKIMGYDFLSKDFIDEMIESAAWTLNVSAPHAIDQEWMQTHEKVKGRDGRDRWQKLDKPIKRNLRELRDFDDDLWYSATHADELDWTKPDKYDVVLVDEVQDFNQAQKKMLQKLTETGAKIVAVGDPNQGMYRFRGADAKAFGDITAMLQQASANPEATTFSMTKNWRSKRGIVDFANQETIVKDLVAGIKDDPDAPAIVTSGEYRQEDVTDLLADELESLGQVRSQTAMIARTNEPLAKAAMDLLKRKVPFLIYGKNLATDIVDVIDRVIRWQDYKVVNDDSDIREFTDELNNFMEEKKEKWSGQQKKQGELKDMLEAQEALNASIEAMIEEEQGKEDETDYGAGGAGRPITIKEMKNWLYKRLGAVPENLSPRKKKELQQQIKEQNPVTLTTAHRSKGLEFDRVFEITPSLYPHPKSKLEADLAQEENARYVAHTRAKDEFHIVDDSKEGE